MCLRRSPTHRIQRCLGSSPGKRMGCLRDRGVSSPTRRPLGGAEDVPVGHSSALLGRGGGDDGDERDRSQSVAVPRDRLTSWGQASPSKQSERWSMSCSRIMESDRSGPPAMWRTWRWPEFSRRQNWAGRASSIGGTCTTWLLRRVTQGCTPFGGSRLRAQCRATTRPPERVLKHREPAQSGGSLTDRLLKAAGFVAEVFARFWPISRTQDELLTENPRR